MQSDLNKGHHAIIAAELVFGHHGGDSSRICRPPESVAQPDDDIDHIEKPDFQVAGKVQDEDGDGTLPGSQVAGSKIKDRGLFVTFP